MDYDERDNYDPSEYGQLKRSYDLLEVERDALQEQLAEKDAERQTLLSECTALRLQVMMQDAELQAAREALSRLRKETSS